MDHASPHAVTSLATPSPDWRPGSFALRDAWFPVAHAPTLGTQPLQRLVHSRRFHLWREAGAPRATAWHPSTPGRWEKSRFTDTDGHYPVIERYGHIWVWYGDPANADPKHLPDLPFLPPHASQPDHAWGVNFFHCTYELVLENILDLTHIDYVHGAYSGSSESTEDGISFVSTSETVTMTRTIRNKPTSAYQRDVLGVTARYQDQTAFTHVFIRSGVCVLHSHYSAAPSIPLMQSNTPECTTLTRANYVFGVQQTDNAAYAQAWPRTASLIAAQDEMVLNPQNPRYLRKAPRLDFSTRFDAAGLHYRKRHNALVARQQANDVSYLPDVADSSDLAAILHIRRMS